MNVAVWGLGPHALRNILPALVQCSGATLAGVCSRNNDTVAEAARKFGCPGWTDPSAMLSDSSVGAVFLSTPIGLHFPQGLRLLAAGKHLWCEKPLGTSLAEAETLVKESESRGLTIVEAFMFLYHPQFARIREVVEQETLGELRSVDCRFGIPSPARPGFRNDPALGGGAFLDVGCYPIAAMTSLFREDPEITLARINAPEGSPVETSGEAVLRYNSGLSATLNWGVGRSYRNEIDFWGTNGSFSTEKIFSKPGDYIPRFRFRDLEGGERWEDGVAGNHFAMMLDSFGKLAGDADAAERERSLILRRAGLSEKIRTQSRL